MVKVWHFTNDSVYNGFDLFMKNFYSQWSVAISLIGSNFIWHFYSFYFHLFYWFYLFLFVADKSADFIDRIPGDFWLFHSWWHYCAVKLLSPSKDSLQSSLLYKSTKLMHYSIFIWEKFRHDLEMQYEWYPIISLKIHFWINHLCLVATFAETWFLNPLWPVDTCMHQWNGSSLVQIMVCHLFDTKL